MPDPIATDRILEAAVELFGEHGFRQTSLKSIAERAGVSAPLVIHHFGSKDGLRRACDVWAAEEYRRAKSQDIDRDRTYSRAFVMSAVDESQKLMRYLIRAIQEGGPAMDELFDRLVDEYAESLSQAQRDGFIAPTEHPRDRAALLLLNTLGAMALGDQMKRQFGYDPLHDDATHAGRFLTATVELYSQAFMTPDALTLLEQFHRSHEPMTNHKIKETGHE